MTRSFNPCTIIALLFVCIIGSGCFGPRKMDKWVAKNYGSIPAASKKNEHISVLSPLVTTDDKLSKSEGEMKKFIPLLVYWRIDYRINCALNPAIAVSNFTSSIGNNRKLIQKLDGRKLELTVERVPNKFALRDNATIIFVGYAFNFEKISILPDSSQMMVSYKLLDKDKTIAKTGTISLPNTDKGVEMGMFQSTRKRTMQYMDDYDAAIRTMATKIAEKLVVEL